LSRMNLKTVMLLAVMGPGGGIGRRAGFRYLWGQPRGSSSLLLGTIESYGMMRVVKLI
jgi:hypothetical protein